MGELLNEPQKFAGVLMNDPVLSFSNKKNISPEQLQKECSDWLSRNQQDTLNVSAFEKADGAAALFVVAFRIHKKRPALTDDMIEWPSFVYLNDDNVIPDWSKLSFNEMLKLFVNNDKMWVLRTIECEGEESKYVSMRVMLYPSKIEKEKATQAETDDDGDQVIPQNQPPPRLQSLYIPHYLRIAMQDFVLRSELMMQVKTGEIHLRAYRCELIMGGEGPWKATAWIKKCRHLKTFENPKSALNKQQFLQYCWERQFDTTDINLKSGVELIVLDDVTRSLDESYIRKYILDDKLLTKSISKLIRSKIATYPERLESLLRHFSKNNYDRHERYLLVSLVRRVHSSNHRHTDPDSLNNKIQELKNRLERYNVSKDGEGFMIAITTSRHTTFFKLKPFQMVTLSHFEAKTQFNESVNKDKWMQQYHDRQNFTLIHLFNGSHFWMTNNLDKIRYDGTLWHKMSKRKDPPKCEEILFAENQSVEAGKLFTASQHQKYIAHDTYQFDDPESVFADNNFQKLRFFRVEENGQNVFYTQSPASIVYAKNCFRLTRWGAFKDINTKNPDDSGERLQDSPDLWQNSHKLFLWAQYFKDARVRLNMKPLLLLERYPRINEFAKNNETLAQSVKDSLNIEGKEQIDEQYEQGVFRDILTIRFMFLLYLSFDVSQQQKHKDECDQCYMHFGVIMRQLLKNWNAYEMKDRERMENADQEIIQSTDFFDIKKDPFCMQEIEFQKIPILRTQFGQGNNSGKKDARDKKRQSNKICDQRGTTKSIPDIIKWLSRNTASQKELLLNTFKPDDKLKRILWEQNFHEDCKEGRYALSWYIKHYGAYFSWNAGGLAKMDARSRILEFDTKQKKKPYKINRYIPDTKINLILPKLPKIGDLKPTLVYEPQGQEVKSFFSECGVEDKNIIKCITECIETLQAQKDNFEQDQHTEINLLKSLQQLSTLLSDEVRDNIWQESEHLSDWWIDYIVAENFENQSNDWKWYEGKIEEFGPGKNKILWEDDENTEITNESLHNCIKTDARLRFETMHVFEHPYTETIKHASGKYMEDVVSDLHVLDLQVISDIFESIKRKLREPQVKNNDRHGFGNVTSGDDDWTLTRLYREMHKIISRHPYADFDAFLFCQWIADRDSLQAILEHKKQQTPFYKNKDIKFEYEREPIRTATGRSTLNSKLSVILPRLELQNKFKDIDNKFKDIDRQIQELLDLYPEQYKTKKSSNDVEDQDEFVIDEEEDNLMSGAQDWDSGQDKFVEDTAAAQDESAQRASDSRLGETDHEIEEEEQESSTEEETTEEEGSEQESSSTSDENFEPDGTDPQTPTQSEVGQDREGSVQPFRELTPLLPSRRRQPSVHERESSLESFLSNTSTTSQSNHSQEFKLFLMLIWKCKEQEQPDDKLDDRVLEKLAELYYQSDLKAMFPNDDET